MSAWRRLQRWLGIEGRAGGDEVIVDRAHEYLSGSTRDPSQALLDDLLARVDRVRVIDGGMSDGRALGEQLLLDVTGRKHVRALAAALRIVEDPQTFGHCMCLGDPAMELLAGSRRLATLGLHHGHAIRWDAWTYDAVLREADALLDWLSARGVHGPRERFDEDQQAARRGRTEAQRWLDAMPGSLRRFWPQRHGGGAQADPELVAALAEEFPDPVRRAGVLFEWFGRGRGTWTGYPSYESTAEQLLLDLPLEVLVEAARGARGEALEGAARLFASWWMARRHPGASAALPEQLRRTMLEHALACADEDKRARARAAFG